MNCNIEARLLADSYGNLNLPEVSFFCLGRGQTILTEYGLIGADWVSVYTWIGHVTDPGLRQHISERNQSLEPNQQPL